MAFLLVSGLGPLRTDSDQFAGTLLGRDYADNSELQQLYTKLVGQPVNLRQMRFTKDGSTQPLLRPIQKDRCLSSVTMRSILECHDIDYDAIDIEALWYDSAEPKRSHYDVVGLSTTFLCNGTHLKWVIQWISDRFPTATLVLGGQFSNLKYATILRDHPEVDYIIRGDAEAALPLLLRALAGKAELSTVPNLVTRDGDGSPVMNPLEYIDIESHPSPSFRDEQRIVPYESMRGCPFTCKYCSFPAASPKWRYKSAEKIVEDWKSYVEKNNAKLISAMDSTFTIPPTRLRSLMKLLPDVGIPWYSYSRANTINSREIVQQLEASHCRGLAIGFESMNDATLQAMDKKVRATENRRAYELLADSQLVVNGSYIIGYPSETPEAYEDTHDFIVHHVCGRFTLNVFGIVDETMPVWAEAEKYQLEVTPRGWKHCGMDQATACRLRAKTVRDVLWNNEDAAMISWQFDFAAPLGPGLRPKQNTRIEKLIERLVYLPRDWGADNAAARRARAIVDELAGLGVHQEPVPELLATRPDAVVGV